MAPMTEPNLPWVWSWKNEVRVKLLLAEYSKYSDIAPLMIDSLTAYIVEGSSSPILGVEPYHAVHPNSLVMIFRFKFSTEERAREIVKLLDEGEYEIEIAFHFAGFQEVSTNFVSITGDQIKGVSSKTAADGGNTNAEYIHRSQATKFISLYNANVQTMIYVESTDFNSQTLSTGMQETFISLMKQVFNLNKILSEIYTGKNIFYFRIKMDNHPQLKETFSAAKFFNARERYMVIFRYIMKTIKRFTVLEEQQYLTIYQINHFKIVCKFRNRSDFFIVAMQINEYRDLFQVNINDYYNKKTKSMVRLQMLIDDLSNKIDTVIHNSGQMLSAASSVQYPRQSIFQQEQIPSASSIRYNSPNYVTETTRPFIQLQQTPSTYQSGRTLDLIQAAPVVAQSQNIWFPSASSTQGPVASGLSSFHYREAYPNKVN
ncbi:unnamed protein product [Rotaria socialis]|uniref:Uncharacterized protein n=2 Tax=Rotaria socialis TaxID=392032 RepID=A0A818U4W7_9BILA|nr:unnamed protein product [Rotaria socialis]CAF4556603.1 unnamed protein product [Rotaria socialis]CAF4894464.1 unnamed protein product [Rotaria socialis]